MNTQWMGRYRPLIAALVQHSNINAKIARQRSDIGGGLSLSALEWQVLEAIIESRCDTVSMISIADRLGVAQSTFSRTAKYLCDLGLVEKYQKHNNRKNIILIPTEQALELYHSNSANLNTNVFCEFFAELDAIDDASIAAFVGALNRLNAALDTPPQDDQPLIKKE